MSILTPFIIFSAWFSQIDDPLSPKTEELLSRIESNASSEAYLFLMGINALENENPIDVGKYALEENQKLDLDSTFKTTKIINNLPLPTGDEFCPIREANCLAQLFSPKIDIDLLKKNNKILITRSNEFLEFDEFTTLSKPSIHEVFAPYQYLSVTERIKALNAISIYRSGDTSKSIDLLLTQISKLRHALELHDTLIGKLVLIIKISDLIDIYSIIATNENLNAEKIPRLSQSEKAFLS